MLVLYLFTTEANHVSDGIKLPGLTPSITNGKGIDLEYEPQSKRFFHISL